MVQTISHSRRDVHAGSHDAPTRTISISDLSVEIGDAVPVEGASFRIPEGRISGFLGPNGAGKSSTIRVLAGLIEPVGGEFRHNGMPISFRSSAWRSRIGLVGEEPGLYERMTVKEQLLFSARSNGMDEWSAIEAIEQQAMLLDFVEDLDECPSVLSKGTRQKVALARGLLHGPDLLLLDEPTANLDVTARAAVEEWLTSRPGQTTLLATHDLDQASRLCTWIIGIYDGRVFCDGEPDEIIARTGASDFRTAFLDLLSASASEVTA